EAGPHGLGRAAVVLQGAQERVDGDEVGADLVAGAIEAGAAGAVADEVMAAADENAADVRARGSAVGVAGGEGVGGHDAILNPDRAARADDGTAYGHAGASGGSRATALRIARCGEIAGKGAVDHVGAAG